MSGLELRALFGGGLGDSGFLMLFSMRLDETGTDGTSRFVTVGGAVAPPHHWDDFEEAWEAYLAKKGVPAFHLKEFDQRQESFENWSDLKCSFFEKRIAKIIESNVTFRCAVSIDSAAHSDVKQRMRGVKGFSPDSDYSLCLRYLMFHACEVLTGIDQHARLAVLVEDGPWVAGAMNTYQKITRMQGPWKPAKHAHRLAGFASRPKGLRSLEAADYIVGREHDRLVAGRKPRDDINRLCHLLSADDLEYWYEGMMHEKEYRRAYASRTRVSG